MTSAERKPTGSATASCHLAPASHSDMPGAIAGYGLLPPEGAYCNFKNIVNLVMWPRPATTPGRLLGNAAADAEKHTPAQPNQTLGADSIAIIVNYNCYIAFHVLGRGRVRDAQARHTHDIVTKCKHILCCQTYFDFF